MRHHRQFRDADLRAIKAEVGSVVKRFRGKKKLTQEQLADRSGLHLTYIAGVETGRRNPTLASLISIASALGVTVSELLAGIENSADL